MGMDVIAYTATPKDTPEKRADHGFIIPGTGDPDGSLPSAWYSGTSKEDLHQFLAQDIDILLISVPLTKDTKHMLAQEEFRILNSPNRKTPPPFIVNIARGAIVDQGALVQALNDGQLRGAALDVADPEPLPSTDPLWDAPNVIITPHVSGFGDAYAERCFDLLAENLRRKREGEKLLNVVNRKTGY
jgi:phosphoglycerate dehydrogenase-like enzyme